MPTPSFLPSSTDAPEQRFGTFGIALLMLCAVSSVTDTNADPFCDIRPSSSAHFRPTAGDRTQYVYLRAIYDLMCVSEGPRAPLLEAAKRDDEDEERDGTDEDATSELSSTEGSSISEGRVLHGPDYMLPALIESRPQHLFNIGDEALRLMMSYLPLEDLLRTRLAGRLLLLASPLQRAVGKFMSLQYPTPNRTNLPKAAVRSRAAASRAQSSTDTNATVSCKGCYAPISLTMPRCTRCSMDAKKSLVSVFFGQLRRDNTDHFPRFLLHTLFPDMLIPKIEPHTSPEGRGKGCSWVFVADDHAAARLVQWSKRLFMDIDDQGREVVFIAAPHDVEDLKQFAAQQSGFELRPPSLPRQPMVLELPKAGTGKPQRREPLPDNAEYPRRAMHSRGAPPTPAFYSRVPCHWRDSMAPLRYRYNPYDAERPFVAVE